MARWGGSPQTYRALERPMDDTKNEVLYTLSSIRETRAKIDRSEFVTVQKADISAWLGPRSRLRSALRARRPGNTSTRRRSRRFRDDDHAPLGMSAPAVTPPAPDRPAAPTPPRARPGALPSRARGLTKGCLLGGGPP